MSASMTSTASVAAKCPFPNSLFNQERFPVNTEFRAPGGRRPMAVARLFADRRCFLLLLNPRMQQFQRLDPDFFHLSRTRARALRGGGQLRIAGAPHPVPPPVNGARERGCDAAHRHRRMIV